MFCTLEHETEGRGFYHKRKPRFDVENKLRANLCLLYDFNEIIGVFNEQSLWLSFSHTSFSNVASFMSNKTSHFHGYGLGDK